MGTSRLDCGDDAAQPARLILYCRPTCHLCEAAKPIVLEVARRCGVVVEERNVEDDERWEAAYGGQVPVAFLAGRKLFKYRVDRGRLLRSLAGR